ncbi:putative retrotransposable element Tf2 155 kDa protein type 1-like, partial [Lyophyllum shimeji]
MANGTIVTPIGYWGGVLELKGIRVDAEFEVFESGGGWDFLFGKRLMTTFGAIHDYSTDTVRIRVQGAEETLHNQFNIMTNRPTTTSVHNVTEVQRRKTAEVGEDEEWIERMLHVRLHVESTVGETERLRHQRDRCEEEETRKAQERLDSLRAERERLEEVVKEEEEIERNEAKARARKMWKKWKGASQRRHRRWKTRMMPVKTIPKQNGTNCDERNPMGTATTTQEAEGSETAPVCVVSEEAEDQVEEGMAEIPTDTLVEDKNLFTRLTDPFKPQRVEEVVRQVRVGDDLSAEEKAAAHALVAEYADIFALSVGEVRHVEGAVHRLNIQENVTFSKKVHQKPNTPPQRKYLHKSIDAMLAAGIIEQCEPSQVKCVSPTTLAQKAHQGAGLSLEELQHRVNDECVAHGMDAPFDLPLRPETTAEEDEKADEPKWRICQNFAQINKVTQ